MSDKNPTVSQIIKEYLKKNEYDGLCGDECGCSLDDLCPCGDFRGDCQAGYKHPCDGECDYADWGCREHFTLDKKEVK